MINTSRIKEVRRSRWTRQTPCPRPQAEPNLGRPALEERRSIMSISVSTTRAVRAAICRASTISSNMRAHTSLNRIGPALPTLLLEQ
jgi:hypothetical protein